MKEKVFWVTTQALVRDAVTEFTRRHIGTLPVVDDGGRLRGILHLRAVVHLVLPSFVDLLDDFGYVADFGALEEQQPSHELLEQPVTTLMEAPFSVRATSGLLRAFAIIYKHELLDLPVVDEQNRLVGIASRVDIGTALLTSWRLDVEQGAT
jgi:CBS domain-containing protein